MDYIVRYPLLNTEFIRKCFSIKTYLYIIYKWIFVGNLLCYFTQLFTLLTALLTLLVVMSLLHVIGLFFPCSL